MDNLVGRQFGPYRVDAPLGEGGMAVVYKAFQPAVNRHVALKILSRHLTSDPQFLRRFRHEARILAQFQHPHILQVYDCGESDGYAFLAMPLIDGGTLADLLHGQPLSLDVTERVIRQLGDALDYAHSKGIVHRDIKPSNVLLDERGNCLLADFGIARMTDGATLMTRTGSMLGTPAYMSPEQADGKAAGPASDIYSLGILLYELLTGRVPFEAETPVAVAIKHLNATLPAPRMLNPALTRALEAVVVEALARLPEDRFASGAAMADALSSAVLEAQALRNRVTVSDDPPPTSSSRRILPAVASVLVVGAIGTLLWLARSNQAGSTERLAVGSSTAQRPAGAPSDTAPPATSAGIERGVEVSQGSEPPDTAQARSQIVQTLVGFKQAIESKDPEALRRVFPAFPGIDTFSSELKRATRGEIQMDAAGAQVTIAADETAVAFCPTFLRIHTGRVPVAQLGYRVFSEFRLARHGDGWVIEGDAGRSPSDARTPIFLAVAGYRRTVEGLLRQSGVGPDVVMVVRPDISVTADRAVVEASEFRIGAQRADWLAPATIGSRATFHLAQQGVDSADAGGTWTVESVDTDADLTKLTVMRKLSEYQRAFESLDAKALLQVYPSYKSGRVADVEQEFRDLSRAVVAMDPTTARIALRPGQSASGIPEDAMIQATATLVVREELHYKGRRAPSIQAGELTFSLLLVAAQSWKNHKPLELDRFDQAWRITAVGESK